MKTFSMRIRDLPNEVVESVVSPIKDFTVFLVYQGGLKGSGTLVKCGDRFGVLTAYHVIHRGRRLDFSSGSTESLGFCVDAYPTALYMPLNCLNLIDVGVPVTESGGPDLSFIDIPPSEHRGFLLSKKSFWDLGHEREIRLAECIKPNGAWWLAYHADERTKIETDERGDLLYFRASIGWSSLRRSYIIDAYDYVETGVDAANEEKGIPESFGGGSGGGVWKVPLAGKPDGVIQAGKPIFAGVMFYETPERTIRCHGPMSIYERVYTTLIQNP